MARYDQSIKLIEEGLGYYPEFTDLEYLRGTIYMGLGKYFPAIRAFRKCIEMGEASSYFNIIIGSGTYRSHLSLGDIYYNVEEYDEALVYYKNAFEENPQFTPAIINYIRTLCAKKPGLKLLKEQLDVLSKKAPGNYYDMVYDTLIQERHYELALRYIQKAEKKYGTTPGAIYYKGLCKLLLKKYRSAITILEPLKNDSEYLVRAFCTQALCSSMQGKYAAAARILSSERLNTEDKVVKVYLAFNTLLETGNTYVLSEDENESAQYTVILFDLLKILILLNEFELFEKALNTSQSSPSTVDL